MEMVHHLTHTQNIYAEENTTVYIQIVKATLIMIYATTIAPFKSSRNGRGTYLALNINLRDQLVGINRSKTK